MGSAQRTLLVAVSLVAAVALWLAWTTFVPPSESLTVSRNGETTVEAPSLSVDDAPVIAQTDVEARQTQVSRASAAPPIDTTSVDSLGATLDVIVLNEKSGEPVADVRVDVSIVEKQSSTITSFADAAFAHADALGRAIVDAPPGKPLYVHVRGHGSGVNVGPMAVGARQEVVLRIPVAEDRVFHGRVVAEEDGTPIVGAEIVLLRKDMAPDDDEDAPIGEVVATTDGEGCFVFAETSLRPSALAVRSSGHALLAFSAEEGHETPERARLLALLRFARLVVTVPDAQGKRVGIELIGYSVREEALYGEVGPDGKCTFETVWPHKSIDVEITRSNELVRRIPFAMTLDPGETREVTWTLGGARIYGSVARADGTPVTKGEVWLLEPFGPQGAGGRRLLYDDEEESLVARGQLEASGNFEFNDVAARAHWVGLSPAGLGDDEYSPAHLITVSGDTHEIRVDLQVERGAFLHGRVVTPDGAPASGVMARTPFDVLGARSGVTDDEGGFRLGPMPAGAYTVTAHGPGGATSAPVIARTGEEGVVLELRPGAVVRGSVIDASTGRLERAQYAMYSVMGNRGFGVTEDGSFEERLVPGSYFLMATTEDGRVSSPLAFDVVAGQELSGLEARLEQGGQLRITSSFPVSLARVRWNGKLVAETVATSTQLHVLTVPLGDVTIELRHGSEALATTHATVVPDVVTEVVLAP